MLYILPPTYNSQEQYGLCHSDSGINISDDFAVMTLQAILFPKISGVSDRHLVSEQIQVYAIHHLFPCTFTFMADGE